jgi:4-hydroxybenzoate polyprenyltransferase
MLNDIADLDDDRLHHSKRQRPFASGELPIAFGLIVARLLILVAIFGAYLLAPAFTVTLLLYLGLTLAYSFGIKQFPLLDVLVISALFAMRVAMGTAILGLTFSPWLLSSHGPSSCRSRSPGAASKSRVPSTLMSRTRSGVVTAARIGYSR